MKAHTTGETRCGDFLAEGRTLFRSGAVMHRKVAANSAHAMRHAKQRCHANTASQKQRVLGLVQWEMIARRTDMDDVTFTDRIVHARGSAARRRVTQDGDAVAVLLARIVAQRVLPGQPAGHLDIDVRTGTEGGQRLAVGAGQLEAGNIFRLAGFFQYFDSKVFHLIHVSFLAAMRRSGIRFKCRPVRSSCERYRDSIQIVIDI